MDKTCEGLALSSDPQQQLKNEHVRELLTELKIELYNSAKRVNNLIHLLAKDVDNGQ